MVERIRANRIDREEDDYNAISGIGSDPGCIESECTPAQIAHSSRHN